jgi:ATP-dependent Clp protease ATP-binding subunit ClpA
MTPERIDHDAAMAELTGSVEALLNQARELADARGHALAGTEHLLLAMTRQSTDSFARRLLDEVGATEPLRARIEGAIGAS